MKTLKFLFVLITTGAFFSSCSTFYQDSFDDYQPTLEEVVSNYDLWYVDIHSTSGNGTIPFVSRAFTLSFLNGNLYANNNIVDIGRTGNGLGIKVGRYNTFNGVLETFHTIDGYHDFEVYVISNNEIELYNRRQNVTYFLIGYNTNTFDYDKLFYENIEYFLQEYVAWEKIATNGGIPNTFDDENYLQFTPENITTFYSSHDFFGTNIDNIIWNYVGDYKVFDVSGNQNIKILTLNYDLGDIEEFELSVINDKTIRLFHINSKTTYDFSGRGFTQYLKSEKTVKGAKETVRNSDRFRTKIQREIKERRHLK
ncbi:MAG: hypothetical protein GW772_05880 [Flavobacteriia bacterium]|nr:hypothetical protein [Flavobacteriia bacterium]OIP47708.1 MAG: hypothetical protein AUK46_04175 [Flavobacteriaceae bacterium CG2_30_31_66]PIV97398.1 MAG: hypothetical protein COW43_03145 [Flavobacteriaceae bacterium CG17_big_fil_post_rev_8_21_14_2_50_31_13]PIX13258.1 MAG: hypothetical protein COZ74_07260 [Flavobacteriaceae bacterium CG_4_8_14_3_um_filter_31_8]PIY14756.1 MAG: hypothetical protein COZ16_07385 [Flavobacteriaceae bacterium CG_4_10_14_3_um_filter_31_253]PIZ12105.1 MAG: hypotheti